MPEWIEIKEEKRPLSEPGDKLVGYFLEMNKFDGEYGETYMVKIGDIDNPDIEHIIYPNVVLKNRLKEATLGNIIKIQYLGLRQSKKSTYQYKDYKVMEMVK